MNSNKFNQLSKYLNLKKLQSNIGSQCKSMKMLPAQGWHLMWSIPYGYIHGVMAIIIGNEHSHLCSNPEWACLHFT